MLRRLLTEQHSPVLRGHLQPAQCQQVSGFSGPNTAPCLSVSSCPPQHQLHHMPADHQTSWGCLGLRHAGSLSSTIHKAFFGRGGFHYTSATIAVHKHLPCHQRQGQASGSSGPVMSRLGACGQAGPSCLAVVSCQFRQSFNVRPPGQCLECRHIRLMQLKHCFAEALLS